MKKILGLLVMYFDNWLGALDYLIINLINKKYVHTKNLEIIDGILGTSGL